MHYVPHDAKLTAGSVASVPGTVKRCVDTHALLYKRPLRCQVTCFVLLLHLDSSAWEVTNKSEIAWQIRKYHVLGTCNVWQGE
jgi:hypothetical protein